MPDEFGFFSHKRCRQSRSPLEIKLTVMRNFKQSLASSAEKVYL
jgi:hypothetical protein